MKAIEWLGIIIVIVWMFIATFSIISTDIFWVGLIAYLLGHYISNNAREEKSEAVENE